jgi:hypothetical protein
MAASLWGEMTRRRIWGAAVVLGLMSSVSITGAWADDDRGDDDGGPVPFSVPKAVCGPEDNAETGLQGQVPAALRVAGFKGFNCNLQLVGQDRIDGGNWQSAEFKDHHGHICAYHGTASPTFSAASASRPASRLGVPVVDVTNESKPTTTAFLQTTAMLDPWESLKVNERRQLLGADNGANGGGKLAVDIYDISDDCRQPQLLSSTPLGPQDGTINGHEGSWAPDGLTYYGGDLGHGLYYAVDTTNPREPRLMTSWKTGISIVHGMSISDDGKRGYFTSLGVTALANLTNPAVAPTNGLLIYDLTKIQNRDPSVTCPTPSAPTTATCYAPPLIGKILWKDGSVAQMTIPVRIGGKPYVIHVDEGGPGGGTSAVVPAAGGPSQQQAAAAAGMPLFPLARIIDISDETNPKEVSKLALEVHNPANVDKVKNDLLMPIPLSIFTYGSHYCSVDNKHHATTLACGYFNSGIRVFDIRNPKRPREIAYYNPAGTTTLSLGTNHTAGNNWVAGGPDWCSAQTHLDAKRGTLWSTCQDNGVLMLKFERHVWPFEDSSTPPGQQN